MSSSLETRLAACERANSRLRRIVLAQFLVWPVGALVLAGVALADRSPAPVASIKAREIAIIDGKGVVRARLSGDLPDGVMANGHVAKRGSKAAGLILYDEQGIERGGYVTQDTGSNVMLTLDSKYRQAALFVAGPDQEQASALRLWSTASGIELRSDDMGSRMSVNDRSGVILQQPVISTISAETCGEYRALAVQYPKERICQSRFTEAACTACLTH